MFKHETRIDGYMLHDPNQGGRTLEQTRIDQSIIDKRRKEKLAFAKAKAKRKNKKK